MPKKNAGAVALGRLGGKAAARAMTTEELSDRGRKAGQAGGAARALKLSKRARTKIAQKAAAARWGNAKE